MELVQSSQMVQQCFQRLRDGKKLQEAVDNDIKDRQEAQTHVAKVDWQVVLLKLHGRVYLFCKTLEVQLLWVFLVKNKHLTQIWSALYSSFYLTYEKMTRPNIWMHCFTYTLW